MLVGIYYQAHFIIGKKFAKLIHMKKRTQKIIWIILSIFMILSMIAWTWS